MCSRSMPQHPFFGAALGGFEACCSMPQHQKFCFVVVIDNCLSASSAPSALFALFARGTFRLTHVSPVLYYLSCHD